MNTSFPEPGNILIYKPSNPPNPYFTLDDLQFWVDYFDRIFNQQVVELQCSHATRRYIIKLMGGLGALDYGDIATRAERGHPHAQITFKLDSGALVPLYPARTERI